MFFWAYALLLIGNNTFLRFVPGWEAWVDPPLHAWHLYVGGRPEQIAIELSITDAAGIEHAVDLDDYFSYRLPNRPQICMPEACNTLLGRLATAAHDRLLAHVLQAYNHRHPEQRAVCATLYRLTWDMRTGDRSSAQRQALLVRRCGDTSQPMVLAHGSASPSAGGTASRKGRP